MANRIIKKRSALRDSLEKLGSPFNWEHITNQVSMLIVSIQVCLKKLQVEQKL